MNVCKIGWHNWKYFEKKEYPQRNRVCRKCGKTQEFVYDFLTFWWSDA